MKQKTWPHVAAHGLSNVSRHTAQIQELKVKSLDSVMIDFKGVGLKAD